MLDWFFHSTWASFGTAGLIVVACGVVAWFVPPFRRLAIEIGAVVLAATAIYAKGARDRADLEQKRKDEAVSKAQKDYADIDARPDSADTVVDKLRRNGF